MSDFPSESPIARVNRERGYNWSLRQIARETGADVGTISRLVSRKALSPDFVTIWKLAQVFEVDIDELVDPAWFRSEDIVTPHGVATARANGLRPSEALSDDAPVDFRRAFKRHAARLHRQRHGLPEPGRKGSPRQEPPRGA